MRQFFEMKVTIKVIKLEIFLIFELKIDFFNFMKLFESFFYLNACFDTQSLIFDTKIVLF